MFNSNTDREWEKIGATDPYFGVITHDKYRKSKLTDENKEDFFRSGYDYIDNVLINIRKHIDPAYSPKRVLDFGCGVGRLVIPLARVAEKVVGVDVSESMLNEARTNCETRSVKNVEFLKSDDRLSLLDDKYDFIHSYIVFQHIPVSRGERIFEKLLAHLEDGGICVIHFTYAKSNRFGKLVQLVQWIKNYIPLVKNTIDLIRGRKLLSPQMQMNTYDLNRLLFLIQKSNVHDFYAQYTNHSGELGILVYFRKPKEA